MRKEKVKKKAKRKQIKDILSEHKKVLRTVLLFLICCFALNLLYFTIAGEQIIPREITAFLVALFLNLFGLNAEANGTLVLMNGTSIDVIGECTGIFSIIVYTSWIFAYPTTVKNKLVGLIVTDFIYANTCKTYLNSLSRGFHAFLA